MLTQNRRSRLAALESGMHAKDRELGRLSAEVQRLVGELAQSDLRIRELLAGLAAKGDGQERISCTKPSSSFFVVSLLSLCLTERIRHAGFCRRFLIKDVNITPISIE
jgi:hypothetical protein